MYKCDVEKDKTQKLSDVPEKDILGRIDGNWRDKIYYALSSKPWKKIPDDEKTLMIDLNPLLPQDKICPPIEEQLPNESRRFWNDVTVAIKSKQFSTATTRKQELEETQRQRAAQRQRDLKRWIPIYFTTVTEADGRPELNDLGRTAMEGMHDDQWHLELPKEYGQMFKPEG